VAENRCECEPQFVTPEIKDDCHPNCGGTKVEAVAIPSASNSCSSPCQFMEDRCHCPKETITPEIVEPVSCCHPVNDNPCNNPCKQFL
jgi:hypothetical protein